MKKLSKIHLRSVVDKFSENEMKFVKGRYVDQNLDYGHANNGATAKPCPPPYRPCNGPHGTWVDGGLCCLVPCNGLLHTYGYAVLTGVNRCSW